jgi:hypothetical protein
MSEVSSDLRQYHPEHRFDYLLVPTFFFRGHLPDSVLLNAIR